MYTYILKNGFALFLAVLFGIILSYMVVEKPAETNWLMVQKDCVYIGAITKDVFDNKGRCYQQYEMPEQHSVDLLPKDFYILNFCTKDDWKCYKIVLKVFSKIRENYE